MKLILLNNDKSTFEDVIVNLMLYCKHTPLQAEQCAHLIHLKGSTDVKVSDNFDELMEIKSNLAEIGLESEIKG